MNLLDAMDNKTGHTLNGALTYKSTLNANLDLFSKIGSLRGKEKDALDLFDKAFSEDATLALKCLFFARDIRGGLGERTIPRAILKRLETYVEDGVLDSSKLEYLLRLLPEFGRWDDLMVLLDTDADISVCDVVLDQLNKDLKSDNPSLLAKWLPSVNASSKEARKRAKHLAEMLTLTQKQYRQICSKLRKKIAIIENNLREKDYTFDYSKQPSKAMLKYRKAFINNDGERYQAYLDDVLSGKKKMNAAAIYPYEIVRKCHEYNERTEVDALDAQWKSLPDYGGDENALVIMDSSGSMYRGYTSVRPIDVAQSLAIYFAERNKGAFKDAFVTFSNKPKVVKIEGENIAEKVDFCCSFNEYANTDLARTFRVILNTAVENHIPAEDMPKKLYIISDMEFDYMVDNGDMTNFEFAKHAYAVAGYEMPQVVFWNVNARKDNSPVTANEQGVALVSGASPQLFEMLKEDILSPLHFMLKTLNSERYKDIKA